MLRHTKYYPPAFTPDGKGLYYSAFPAPPAGRGARALRIWATRSTTTRSAATRPRIGGCSAMPRIPTGSTSRSSPADGRWLVVLAGEGEVGDKARENVYLFDLAVPEPPRQSPLALGFEAAFVYVGADAGRLFFLTSLDAPRRGACWRVDPQHPERSNWREVIAQGADAIDLSVAGAQRDAGRSSADRADAARRAQPRAHLRTRRDAARRGAASRARARWRASTATREDRETFYSYSSLVTPPTIYRYDLDAAAAACSARRRWPSTREAFEQRQVFYRGKDGTRIPMLLAWRKGMRLAADHPLLLYGYGGFGLSTLPAFNPARIAWLEMGGVFAMANIRGGGEYGEAWHRAGMRTHKQVVFDDFIAAAEWLIAQHYTSARRLAIHGRSNGGLLVGACVTQRPELFAAAIAQVGVLDMLRFNRFGQGAGWEGDYGSPAGSARSSTRCTPTRRCTTCATAGAIRRRW